MSDLGFETVLFEVMVLIAVVFLVAVVRWGF